MTATETDISPRATAIVCGLLRTNRAIGLINREFGMLRLRCRSGGFYWIMLEDTRVYRGKTFINAEELQPKFIDAMERAGQ